MTTDKNPGPAISDPRNIQWTKAYRSPPFLTYISSALIHFGLTEVLRATIFRRLKEVEENWAKNDPSYMDEERRKLMIDLMNDHLVDDFRIITFYENWMKSVLLREGVCIHLFQDAKGDDFRTKTLNKVLRRPWSGSNIDVAGITDAEITQKTIGMKELLSKQYQHVIKLPDNVLGLVKQINGRRNRLHFNTMIEFGMGPSVITEYRILMDHINKCLYHFPGKRYGFGPMPGTV